MLVLRYLYFQNEGDITIWIEKNQIESVLHEITYTIIFAAKNISFLLDWYYENFFLINFINFFTSYTIDLKFSFIYFLYILYIMYLGYRIIYQLHLSK